MIYFLTLDTLFDFRAWHAVLPKWTKHVAKFPWMSEYSAGKTDNNTLDIDAIYNLKN
jgi:hypothetical protein